jgi:hypothetical protein
MAERAGIDPKLAVDVMTESPIGSPMLKARAPLVLDLLNKAWFDVSFMQKDVALALDTGRQLHVPLPSAAVADQLLTIARALGYDHRGLASLLLADQQGDEPGDHDSLSSTQRSSRAETKTASVMSAARRPSANVGIPATAEPLRMLS